jgi:ABC-type dipeptide/oligopeptide/nickel transport system ATPase component
MSSRIIFSDGGKGGVGKSMVATALVDYLSKKGLAVAAIEADITNRDVSRIFDDHPDIKNAEFDLRESFDWTEFVVSVENLLTMQDIQIVVNLPATINFRGYLTEAVEAFKMMNLEVIGLFTLNRYPESVKLLGESLNEGILSMAHHRVAILNGLHGEPHQFERFNDSDAKNKLLDGGGKIAYFPELNYRACDLCLLENNKTFSLMEKAKIPVIYKVQIG